MENPCGYPASARKPLSVAGHMESWRRPLAPNPGSDGSKPTLSCPKPKATLLRIAALSIAWAIACRTLLLSHGDPAGLLQLTPIQMPSPSTTVLNVALDEAFSVDTLCGGTCEMRLTCPLCSCATRVLSVGTILTLIES